MKRFSPILCLLLLTACASVAPNADPVEVRAEQSIALAADTMDLFIDLEWQNQFIIIPKAPKVHEFAEWLREYIPYPGARDGSGTLQRGLVFIEQANDARRTYKALRSVENRTKLSAALTALEQTLYAIQSHLLETQEVVNPGPGTKPAPSPGLSL